MENLCARIGKSTLGMLYCFAMDARDFKINRVILGFTQKQLADELEINSNTVSRYETGDLTIPKTVAYAVLYLVFRLTGKIEQQPDRNI